MARCKLPCCTTPARPARRPADYEPDYDGPVAWDWRDDYERRVYGRPQARYLPELPAELPELGELSDACGIDRHYGTRGL